MAHTIMIVDDNPDDIEIARIALSKTGREIKVKTASRGEIALELLQEEDELPSLILLDLKMPGMSGINTLCQIRLDARFKAIPVVIVTSSTLESDEKQAYAAGADNFIHKAFDIEQFTNDIKNLLERWQIK